MLDTAQNALGRPLLAAAKRILPWVVLGIVLLRVFTLYGAYTVDQVKWDRAQSRPTPSQLAAKAAGTKTAPAKSGGPAKTAPAVTTSKVLIVSSVTLRKDPSTSADAIRDLRSGEKLGFIGQVGQWYKVSDKGRIAWVSASSKFTKIVDK